MGMISVVIEVWNEATRFSVLARAERIQGAASLAATAYPNADVRVKFPIDPEAFFLKDPAARAEMVGFERQEEMAA
jgi:hypothetical protein